MAESTAGSVGRESRYHKVEEWGSGSFGLVFKALDLETNTDVALKILNQGACSPLEILREVAILRQCRHPTICPMLDLIETDENSLVIVLPFVVMNLKNLMDQCPKDQLWKFEHCSFIMYQMLCGVQYLHSAGILHRDLKPVNILVDLNCRVQIIDFGLSRHAGGATADGLAAGDATEQAACLTPFLVMEARRLGRTATSPAGCPNFCPPGRDGAPAVPAIQQTPLSQHVATRWYRAPEVLLQSQYNSSADMWGLGCIWAELLQTLQGPWAEPSPLFPGASSQLSASHKIRHCKGGLSAKPQPVPKPDKQLTSILSVIGMPSEEEFNTVLHSKTYQQLQSCPLHPDPNHNDLATFRTELGLKHDQQSVSKLPDLFAFAPADAQQLLSRLLVFDPAKRCTAAGALASTFLLDEEKWWCADNDAVSLQQLDDGKMEFEFETDSSTALRSTLLRLLDGEIDCWNRKHASSSSPPVYTVLPDGGEGGG